MHEIIFRTYLRLKIIKVGRLCCDRIYVSNSCDGAGSVWHGDKVRVRGA